MATILRITDLRTGVTTSHGTFYPGQDAYNVHDRLDGYATQHGLLALASRDMGIDGISATVLVDVHKRPVALAVVHPMHDGDMLPVDTVYSSPLPQYPGERVRW